MSSTDPVHPPADPLASVFDASKLLEFRARRVEERNRARERNAKLRCLPKRSAGRRSIATLTDEFVAHIARALRQGVSFRFLIKSMFDAMGTTSTWQLPRRTAEWANLERLLYGYLHDWASADELRAVARPRSMNPWVRSAQDFALAAIDAVDSKPAMLQLARVTCRAIVRESRLIDTKPALLLDMALELGIRDFVAMAVGKAREHAETEALMGPWLESDDARMRTSPALQRAREAGLRVAPVDGSQGARWLGAFVAKLAPDMPSILGRYTFNATAETMTWGRDATEKQLARSVRRIVKEYAAWRALVEAPADDDHPMLCEARAAGLEVARSADFKPGWSMRLEGERLIVHDRLTNGQAWTFTSEHIEAVRVARAQRDIDEARAECARHDALVVVPVDVGPKRRQAVA